MFAPNEKGFTLVEVLIAVAIMGAISVVSMKMMENQNKSANTTEAKFESFAVLNDIQLLLSERESCRKTFGITPGAPKNTGSHVLANINPGDITDLYYKNDKYGVEEVRYTANSDVDSAPQVGSSDIKLLSLDVEGTVPNESAGQVNLVVELHRGSPVFGPEVIAKKIPFNVLTDSSGTLIDCSTAGVIDTDDIGQLVCNSLGGVYHNTSAAKYGRGGGPDCRNIKPNADDPDEAYDPDNPETHPGEIVFNGNVKINDGFAFTLMSDQRLKEGARPLDSSLENIRKLSPIRYEWKANGQTEIGFLAQEVGKLYPELVVTGRDGKHSLKYAQLSAVNLGGIKELDKENARLKHSVKSLQKENGELRRELGQIKELVCGIKPEAAQCL